MWRKKRRRRGGVCVGSKRTRSERVSSAYIYLMVAGWRGGERGGGTVQSRRARWMRWKGGKMRNGNASCSLSYTSALRCSSLLVRC